VVETKELTKQSLGKEKALRRARGKRRTSSLGKRGSRESLNPEVKGMKIGERTKRRAKGK